MMDLVNSEIKFARLRVHDAEVASGAHHCFPECEFWSGPSREGREGDTQPISIPNGLPVIHELMIEEVPVMLRQRLAVGIHRYGTGLQPFNGRDACHDAIEEAVDLLVYVRQAQYEAVVLRRLLTQVFRSTVLEFGETPWTREVGEILNIGVSYSMQPHNPKVGSKVLVVSLGQFKQWDGERWNVVDG